MIIFRWIFPLLLYKILKNIQTSVALDGNPEPDLVHATGCKQPTLSIFVCLAVVA
jgi:hypothetical protein